MTKARPVRGFRKSPSLTERLADRFVPVRVDPRHRTDECTHPMTVIFAFPRTGSSAIVRAIRSEDFQGVMEPFGPVKGKERQWRLKYHPSENGDDVRHSVSRLWRRGYRFIKHLHSQLPMDDNDRMLLTPGLRIVYLYRENLLENQLSLYIARKSGEWNSTNLYPYPVSIRKISKLMVDAVRVDRHYRRILRASAAEHMIISYEDIFQRGRAERLFEFFGREPANPNYLHPSQKLKSEVFYRAIPNIRELNEVLGSDHYGRIALD